MKGNPVNWFEIPANDLDRAKSFYESVFDVEYGFIAHFEDSEGNRVALHTMVG